MAQKPPPGPQQVTKGPKKAAPCPWCNKPNDLAELEDLQLLEIGAQCSCDHCGKLFAVARIEPIVVIFLKPITRANGFRR
jgi:hypothetical protein